MDLDWMVSWCRYGFGDSVLSLDPSIFCLVSVGVDMDGVLLGLRLWCRYWVDLLGYRVLNGWVLFLVQVLVLFRSVLALGWYSVWNGRFSS